MARNNNSSSNSVWKHQKSIGVHREGKKRSDNINTNLQLLHAINIHVFDSIIAITTTIGQACAAITNKDEFEYMGE